MASRSAQLRPARTNMAKNATKVAKAIPHNRLTRNTSSSKAHKFLELIDGPSLFPAFKVSEELYQTRDGHIITVPVAGSPETGIHSSEWARAIKPQTGFNSLSVELRQRIYHALFYLTGLSCNPLYERSLGKFLNVFHVGQHIQPLTSAYIDRSLVCRQFYVDIVGFGMFYRIANFHFDNIYSMNKYISVINPFHTSVIKNLTMEMRIYKDNTRPLQGLIELAATKLPSLESLSLDVCHEGCYDRQGLVGNVELWKPLAGRLKKCVFRYESYSHGGEQVARENEVMELVKELLIGRKLLA